MKPAPHGLAGQKSEQIDLFTAILKGQIFHFDLFVIMAENEPSSKRGRVKNDVLLGLVVFVAFLGIQNNVRLTNESNDCRPLMVASTVIGYQEIRELLNR